MVTENPSMNEIEALIRNFRIEGTPYDCTEIRSGHINRTYLVYTKEGEVIRKYLLQMINTSIFKKPEELMENIIRVTGHIADKVAAAGEDPTRRTLHFLQTTDGKWMYTAPDNSTWRCYHYIDALSLQQVDSTEMFERVGRAFGNFQRQLSDFDASLLHETIPDFHNTVSRYNDFLTALEKDTAHRAAGIPDEIRFVKDHENICSFIMDGIASGRFPLRVTHNDTKLNNILVDEKTGEGICVIDLDTVMPGSVLGDFGDSIRFGASSAAEDETDLDKVYVRLDLFEAYTKGFLTGLDHSLTDAEIRAFPMGALMLTLETGIRFLTDYLNGDTYFRTAYPAHNLDRAKNQFKLVSDMEVKMDEMNRIVQKYL